MTTDIELGDEVIDIYTGFKGVVMARTLFINGCVQFSVAPKWDGKLSATDTMMTEIGIDSQSLKVTKRGQIYKDKQKEERRKCKEESYDTDDHEDDDKATGGPSRRAARMRGY